MNALLRSALPCSLPALGPALLPWLLTRVNSSAAQTQVPQEKRRKNVVRNVLLPLFRVGLLEYWLGVFLGSLPPGRLIDGLQASSEVFS